MSKSIDEWLGLDTLTVKGLLRVFVPTVAWILIYAWVIETFAIDMWSYGAPLWLKIISAITFCLFFVASTSGILLVGVVLNRLTTKKEENEVKNQNE